VTASVYVLDEKDITIFDIIDLKVTIVSLDFSSARNGRLAHCINYPFLREERLHLYLSNKSQEITYYDLVASPYSLLNL